MTSLPHALSAPSVKCKFLDQVVEPGPRDCGSPKMPSWDLVLLHIRRLTTQQERWWYFSSRSEVSRTAFRTVLREKVIVSMMLGDKER